MASKVNTKFVIILVGAIVTVAVGVGALAAYSLRMSGERNIAAGDQKMAEAQQFMASGNETEAIELINDAASQYGRAVNKDPSRRDWLIAWRDALLQTIPETDVEYSKQYLERYRGALDRLATLDPTAPGPQLEQVLVQEEISRVNVGPNNLQAITDLVARRSAALPVDSPTAIRLKAIGGLAVTDRALIESVDPTELDEAREAMREFYDSFIDDQARFLEPVPGDLDQAGRERFVEQAREDHARIGLGLVRWHFAQRIAAQREGRTQDAATSLARADEVLNGIFADGRGYESDARFRILATLIDLEQTSDAIANPADLRDERDRIFRESVPAILSALAATDASDLPYSEWVRLVSWFRDSDVQDQLVAELERGVSASPSDPRVLNETAQAMRLLGRFDRALELYVMIRDLPRPALSLEGLLLPQVKVEAAFAQVQVNLELRDDFPDRADEFLTAARAARDVLVSESGVQTQRAVLRADAELAIAEGKTTQAIRLLEEYRSEFGDNPMVLRQLADQLLRQDTVGEAKEIIEQLVAASRVNAQGVLLLADIYRAEGDLERALDLLVTQSRRSATPEEFADAIQNIERLIALEAGETIDDPVFAALNRATGEVTRRDFEAAAATLDKLEQTNPEVSSNLRVILLRADIARLAGDEGQMRELLERAQQVAPDNDRLAAMIQQRLNPDEMVQDRLEAIDASDRPEIDKALAKFAVLRSVGRTDDALAMIDEAEALDPDHPSVIEIRFSQALRLGELDTAAQIAARAADANTDGVDGLLYQGRLQLARGEIDAAVRTLRSAIELIPSSAPIRRYLGQALLAAGQIDEGLDSLRRAHEARRGDTEVLMYYVSSLVQLGRAEEARAVLDPGNDPLAPARTDRAFTNRWLSLEAQTGNRERALRERRTYFRSDLQSGAIAKEAESQQNALGLVELLISDDDLGGAEQVLTQVEPYLSERDLARARTAVAFGRASELEDPEAVREAESRAIADFRATAEADAATASDPTPLLEVAQFAFLNGRFELGLEVLEDARAYESAETKPVSRAIAERLTQRADALDRQADRSDAEARRLEATDPLSADASRESAAQARGRASASREEAARIYEDLLATGVEDSSSSIATALAQLRLQLGQLERAEEIIERVRATDSDNLTAILLAANLEERRDNRSEAGRLYNLAVERHPSNFMAFYRRAQFNSSDPSRRADVLFDLQRVNALRPSLVDAWRARFNVNRQANDPEAAFAVLREGIEQAPSIADELTTMLVQELVNTGQIPEASSVATRRANADPPDPGWQLTAAQLASRRGAHSEAANFYERLGEIPDIADDPTLSAEVSAYLLDALLRAGDRIPEARLRNLASDVEQLPTEGLAGVERTMLLARAYATVPSERGRVSGLIQQAYAIAAQGSENASATRMLQAWYEDLALVAGGGQQALDYVASIDQAIRAQRAQDPAAEIPHPLYVQTIALQAAQNRGESLSDLIERGELLLQQTQQDPLARFELHKRLSSLKFAAGDVEGATDDGQKALAINPNDLELLNNVAFFLAKYLDRVEEAVPYAQRASQRAPENADVLDTVGVVYLLNGDYSRAADLFERSLRFARTQEQRLPANIHMADTLMRTEAFESARTYLEAAERLLPIVSENVRDRYASEVSELRARLDNR